MPPKGFRTGFIKGGGVQQQNLKPPTSGGQPSWGKTDWGKGLEGLEGLEDPSWGGKGLENGLDNGFETPSLGGTDGYEPPSWGGKGFGGKDGYEPPSWGGMGFGQPKGGRGCYNCGLEGHIARECPEAPSGKGKGKGKEKRGPSGPNLERTRITQEPVTGSVVEWKGKYGWIMPTIPVEHEKAERHGGRIYVSMTDLVGGIEALSPESICQFHIFTDASGLGAEEVIST